MNEGLELWNSEKTLQCMSLSYGSMCTGMATSFDNTFCRKPHSCEREVSKIVFELLYYAAPVRLRNFEKVSFSNELVIWPWHEKSKLEPLF